MMEIEEIKILFLKTRGYVSLGEGTKKDISKTDNEAITATLFTLRIYSKKYAKTRKNKE